MLSFSSAATAVSSRWIERRKPHWTRLEALVAACGAAACGARRTMKLRELALLYRQTAADLSVAREDRAERGARPRI